MINKKIILIDFDYTLFNTSKFIKDKKLIDKGNSISLKKYLYPDAEKFLKYSSKFGRLILFSEGEDGFQKAKIEGVNLSKYFSGKIKVYKPYAKMKEFKKFTNKKNIILIDDKPNAIDAAIKLGAVAIRVRRGKYANIKGKLKPTYIVQSLKSFVDRDILRKV